MKKIIFLIGVFYMNISCNKTDISSSAPIIPVVAEEPIKFSTNLDTGAFNVTDTIPLVVNVSSKVPASGLIYSITSTWTDSSKLIYKLDTLLNTSSLNVNLPGENRMGNYAIQITVTSKSTSTNNNSKTLNAINIPILPAINTDINPDINWNDVVQGRNNSYDFNGDGIPDIISYKRITSNSPLPPIFYINDYSGRNLYTLDIKKMNPNIRDSLNNIIYDYRDLNGDGLLDLALTYMGEWWTGQPGQPGSIGNWYGINTYLLFNKGNMQFDIVEVINDPKFVQFNVTLFDWDFDGKVDMLTSSMQDGIYYKNIGNNKFEKRSIVPLFQQAINLRGVDFDRDGKDDFINFYINEKDEKGNYVSSNMNQTISVVTSKEVLNFPVIGKTIEKNIYIGANTTSAERINMVDGDGDGDLDLVIGYILTENGAVSHFQEYYENTGSQFVYKQGFIENDKTLYDELQVWSADIDHDGLKDLYYPTYSKSRLNNPKGAVFWWRNTKQGFKIMKNFRLKY